MSSNLIRHKWSNKQSCNEFVLKLRGLPFTTQESDTEYFLYDVKLKQIHLIMGDKGQINGEAFVLVENEFDAKSVLSHNGRFIGHRFIEIQLSSKSELHWWLNKSCKPDGTVKLLGLPYVADKSHVAEFFNGLAIVPNGIGLLRDRSGRLTGEAYVQFASPEIARQAASKHKEKMKDRYIEIYPSSLKASTAAIERQMYINMGVDPSSVKRDGLVWVNSKPHITVCGTTNSSFRSTGNGELLGGQPFEVAVLGAAGYPPFCHLSQFHRTLNQFPTNETRLASQATLKCSNSQCHVRMRGLPFSATMDDIIRFFRPIEPFKILIRTHQDGKPNGTADVYFCNAQDTREAMKRQRAAMGARYIELFSSVRPL